MQSDTLTYASPRDPLWKRWTMRAIEDLSGRRGLLPVYYRWRRGRRRQEPAHDGRASRHGRRRIEIDAPALAGRGAAGDARS